MKVIVRKPEHDRGFLPGYSRFLEKYDGEILELSEHALHNKFHFYVENCEQNISGLLAPVIRKDHFEVIGIDFRIGRSFCDACKKIFLSQESELCPFCESSSISEFFPGSRKTLGMDDEITNLMKEVYIGY